MTQAICGCGESFDTLAELGNHRRSCSESGTEPEYNPTNERDSTPTMDVDNYAVAWIGGSEYRVIEKEDGVSVKVDLRSGTVTYDDPSDENKSITAEARLAAAQAHHTNPELEYSIMEQWAGLIRDVESALARVNAAGGAPAGGSGGGGSGGSDGDEEEESKWSDSPRPDNADVMVAAVEDWIAQYSELKSDLDPKAVEVKAGEYDGTPGVMIDSNPFAAGYYKDGDWADKDGFDAHKEALKAVTQGEDAIQYHGDPDWINFIPAEKVEEVTG